MAKKKYYQNKKDRMDESRGMKRYYREKADMLHEDRSKPSNLPQEVMMKQYPERDYLMADAPDDWQYMDMQANQAVRKAQRYLSKKKY